MTTKKVKEDFETTDDEAKQISATIFIVIGCMMLAGLIVFLLYWAHSVNKKFFSGILWTFVFFYTIVNVVFIAVSKNRLKPAVFRFFIALHSAFGLMSLGLLSFYYIRTLTAVTNPTGSPGGYSYGAPPTM